MRFSYDVIVIGGGHAGCEAAYASARLGAATLLITADLNRVAQMSCNPAVGGIAKGQIVREIDAMGGMSGIVADTTAVQFRMLNRSKGPAVWSPRVQSDRTKYIEEWRKILDSTQNLYQMQDIVTSFQFEKSDNGTYKIIGVETALGIKLIAKKVILTAGTFLNGLMHFGPVKIEGGRISESSSYGLTSQLKKIGFEVGRMKTGTPARVDGHSIDFSKCEIQWGDDEVSAENNAAYDGNAVPVVKQDFHKFSFLPSVKRPLVSRPCFITHTNSESHRILSENLKDSPLYNGDIQSIGPRYCPSIETKIVTFADKDSHQLFLEPEGETTSEYYINGFSSSLPWKVQLDSLSSIEPLSNIQFLRPGYAIEYDYFPPIQLYHTLETKIVDGLYMAGQVNGTTGYEEAAAQGMMAGINAARRVKGEEEVILRRDQGYIGVLIDDLVTKGVDEPYRMFTSRAEYRILLRQDNADSRLTPLGYEIGLATKERYEQFKKKERFVAELVSSSDKIKIKADVRTNDWLLGKGTTELKTGCRIVELIRRPQLNIKVLRELSSTWDKLLNNIPSDIRDEVTESAEILIKYEGYIKREQDLADKQRRLEEVRIPDYIDYFSMKSISTEGRQKLNKHKPLTIGQASRISGVSPSDINVLLLTLRN
ncbi:MAG: tRNA uridine-5-carboxymethylaminomethyl(34) synthesis enzyme MnmG [Muribaculaceae bacterium]|nr:tRNA uridine-5-carboxymethylaminomethyl(34) synthesis enzyme MnmG [Muribaculaceae bacterium]